MTHLTAPPHGYMCLPAGCRSGFKSVEAWAVTGSSA